VSGGDQIRPLRLKPESEPYTSKRDGRKSTGNLEDQKSLSAKKGRSIWLSPAAEKYHSPQKDNGLIAVTAKNHLAAKKSLRSKADYLFLPVRRKKVREAQARILSRKKTKVEAVRKRGTTKIESHGGPWVDEEKSGVSCESGSARKKKERQSDGGREFTLSVEKLKKPEHEGSPST